MHSHRISSILRGLATLAFVVAAVIALRLFVLQPSTPPALLENDSRGVAAADSASTQNPVLMATAKAMLTDAERLRKSRGALMDVLDGRGAVVGYIVDTTGLPDLATGYGGRVPVAILLDPTGTIVGVTVLKNAETPSYLEHVKNEGLTGQFVGMTLEQALNARVDAVSGATMTSSAILSAVKAGAADSIGTQFKAPGTSVMTIVRQVSAALVLLIGFVAATLPRRFRRFRPFILVAIVLVPGFWTGMMLSSALLASWIPAGPDLRNAAVPFAAFIAAIVLPAFTGRNVWCGGVCPFGSISELVSMIPIKKLAPGPRTRIFLRYAGLVYLCTIIGLLVVWPDLDLASFEPFAAFSAVAAPIASIVIFATFLVTSLFCRRLWCRFLCPTGRILDFVASGTCGIVSRKCAPGAIGDGRQDNSAVTRVTDDER